jgi:hypothetical protein
MTDKFTIGDRDVLLIVDIQNDFCPAAAWRCRVATRSCH